jgi:SAM-dependent methyltransferase
MDFLSIRKDHPRGSEILILNVGCGDDKFGDIRLDLYGSTANVRADGQVSLPFVDNAFDKVYSRWFMEHIRNPGHVLAEMARITRDEGEIVVVTDNAAYLTWHVGGRAGKALGGFHSGAYRGRGSKDLHYALFTADHLRNHFIAAGLRIVDGPRYVLASDVSEFPGGIMQRLAPALKRLTPSFATFFYPHIIVAGVKHNKSLRDTEV